MSLVHLLRDMSRSNLHRLPDECEQRRTTYELRKTADMKVLNTKKALADAQLIIADAQLIIADAQLILADAQLILAGAMSPAVRATGRLVRSKALLAIKNANGEKMKSAAETA